MIPDTLEQVILSDLEPLCPQELEGGMRALCTLMVSRTCTALTGKTQLREDSMGEKRAAQGWLEGGVGTVTFEQACSLLDYDCECARNRILRYVATEKARTIKLIPPKETRSCRTTSTPSTQRVSHTG